MVAFDPGLQPLVEQAVADLARRLRVEASTITVESARLVQWPDAGMGVDDGLRRKAVPVDGSEIVLGCGGERFSYRTGGAVFIPQLSDRAGKNRGGGTPSPR